MKIIIFGATGTVGKKLVEKALQNGHEVTAFVRDPAGMKVSNSLLKIVQGDVLNLSSVETAVAGQQAVICALGDGRNGTVRAAGTKNIILAMEKVGIARLICQSSLGVGDSRACLNFFWKYIMFGLLLKKAYNDHIQQENLVMKSKLDWILVRPGAFTDGPLTGKYRHGFPADDQSTRLKISRADVADFMLKQLTDSTYLKQTPGLSY